MRAQLGAVPSDVPNSNCLAINLILLCVVLTEGFSQTQCTQPEKPICDVTELFKGKSCRNDFLNALAVGGLNDDLDTSKQLVPVGE